MQVNRNQVHNVLQWALPAWVGIPYSLYLFAPIHSNCELNPGLQGES